MHNNCATAVFDLLVERGGRFVAVGSRRGPLMHSWHESANGVVSRYEPESALPHWSHAVCGYVGRTVDYPQREARPMTPSQIVGSAWALAVIATLWAIRRRFRRRPI